MGDSRWAAMLYATFSVTIGLFTYLHDWTGARPAGATE